MFKAMILLFSDSRDDLKKTTTLTVTALFAAISIILGYLTIAVGDYIKIGFSMVAGQLVSLLFGPVVGGIFGGITDLLKFIVRPTGPFFPGWTLSAMLAGMIYGCFYYKNAVSFRDILTAELLVSIICNIFLGTLWLHLMYGKAFILLLPMRALKNLIMWPINSMLFYSLAKAMESTKMIKKLKGTWQENISKPY